MKEINQLKITSELINFIKRNRQERFRYIKINITNRTENKILDDIYIPTRLFINNKSFVTRHILSRFVEQVNLLATKKRNVKLFYSLEGYKESIIPKIEDFEG